MSTSSQQSSERSQRVAERHPITRIAVVQHGRPERLGDAPARLRELCERRGVEVVDDDGGDPQLAIEWLVSEGTAVLSEKDRALPPLAELPRYFD